MRLLYVAFDDANFFDSETPTDHRPPNLTVDAVQQGLAKGDVVRAIYDDTGKMLATSWFELNDEVGDLYIHNLCVMPALRDSGVGSFLLGEAEREARARNYARTSLHVDPLNSRGLFLYLRKGYKATAYEQDNSTGLQRRLVMQKQLAGPASLQSEAVRVPAGDDQHLRQILGLGYIGTSLLLDTDGNPRHNQLIFSAPSHTN